MGYETYFTLVVTNKEYTENILDYSYHPHTCTNSLSNLIATKFKSITEYAIDDLSYSLKWYSYEEDMRKLSIEFPEYLFVLDGVGEEPNDVWRMYFHNGRVQFYFQPDWEPPPPKFVKRGKDKGELTPNAGDIYRV